MHACAGSLGYNNLGADGAKIIADVLPQTKIESLKCAALLACEMASCPPQQVR